jgi:7-cyano-7-deazaguanine synthase
MKKAVILLSGGLDSAVLLWLTRSQGFELHTLSFDYGQKHIKELKSAEKLANLANVKSHRVITLKLDAWGGSALTDKSMEIETGNIERNNIPNTYVPARNMVFLSVAASFAEAIGAYDIFIGVSQVDYSGYADCRHEFIEAMQNAINKGTVTGVEKKQPITIHTPFIDKTKTDEILLAVKLGVPLEHTWSCYKGDEKPCGICDSCLLRAKAFEKAGIKDNYE